ncbi:hypothetical protein DFH07DRAFT_765436 [Mycena maculata]|uniref:Uncharacterized protein n=1 Tax=Mycena maculata TaxID=230809 RepID=A0AAD7K7W6_9AGAR|nr:hypothetical protein DFH07DRAFT_765436 [Mycena maculata]
MAVVWLAPKAPPNKNPQVNSKGLPAFKPATKGRPQGGEGLRVLFGSSTPLFPNRVKGSISRDSGVRRSLPLSSAAKSWRPPHALKRLLKSQCGQRKTSAKQDPPASGMFPRRTAVRSTWDAAPSIPADGAIDSYVQLWQIGSIGPSRQAFVTLGRPLPPQNPTEAVHSNSTTFGIGLHLTEKHCGFGNTSIHTEKAALRLRLRYIRGRKIPLETVHNGLTRLGIGSYLTWKHIRSCNADVGTAKPCEAHRPSPPLCMMTTDPPPSLRHRCAHVLPHPAHALRVKAHPAHLPIAAVVEHHRRRRVLPACRAALTHAVHRGLPRAPARTVGTALILLSNGTPLKSSSSALHVRSHHLCVLRTVHAPPGAGTSAAWSEDGDNFGQRDGDAQGGAPPCIRQVPQGVFLPFHSLDILMRFQTLVLFKRSVFPASISFSLCPKDETETETEVRPRPATSVNFCLRLLCRLLFRLFHLLRCLRRIFSRRVALPTCEEPVDARGAAGTQRDSSVGATCSTRWALGMCLERGTWCFLRAQTPEGRTHNLTGCNYVENGTLNRTINMHLKLLTHCDNLHGDSQRSSRRLAEVFAEGGDGTQEFSEGGDLRTATFFVSSPPPLKVLCATALCPRSNDLREDLREDRYHLLRLFETSAIVFYLCFLHPSGNLVSSRSAVFLTVLLFHASESNEGLPQPSRVFLPVRPCSSLVAHVPCYSSMLQMFCSAPGIFDLLNLTNGLAGAASAALGPSGVTSKYFIKLVYRITLCWPIVHHAATSCQEMAKIVE